MAHKNEDPKDIIPADVLSQIFENILSEETAQRKNITQLMQVNKRWQGIFDNKAMWQKIILNAGEFSRFEAPTGTDIKNGVQTNNPLQINLINLLHDAIYAKKFLRTLKQILKQGSDLIDKTIFREVLLKGIKNNSFGFVQLLCEAKRGSLTAMCDMEYWDKCVVQAAYNSYSEDKLKIVQYLLQLNQDIFKFPKFEESIAIFSVRRLKDEKITKVILQNIADSSLLAVDENNNKLIDHAIFNGLTETIGLLLNRLYKAKADLVAYHTSKSDQGLTPFHYAALYNPDCFYTLLTYINVQQALTITDNEKNTVLHTLLENGGQNFDKKLFNFLLTIMKPATLNAKNIHGDTALHIAFRKKIFVLGSFINNDKIDKLLYNKKGLRPDQQGYCEGIFHDPKAIIKEVVGYEKSLPRDKEQVAKNILRQIDNIKPDEESVMDELTAMYQAIKHEQKVLCKEQGGMKWFGDEGKTTTWKTCVNALKTKALELLKSSEIVKQKMAEEQGDILFEQILNLKTSRVLATEERTFQNEFTKLSPK